MSVEQIENDPDMPPVARLWARIEAYQRGEFAQLFSSGALDDIRPVHRLLTEADGSSPVTALALSAVAWFHWYRYCLQTGEPAERELRMALAASEGLAKTFPDFAPPEALALARTGVVDPAVAADNAGRRLGLARETGDQHAFNEALAALAQAIERVPADAPDHVLLRAQLAAGWRNRCEDTGDVASADRAIEIGTALVEELPEHHPLVPSLLSDLALAHLARHNGTRSPDDLDAAVRLADLSTASPADGPAEQSRIVSNAAIIHSRARRRDDAADDSALDQAVALGRTAVEVTEPGDRDLPGRLENLASDLFMQHVRTTAREPLDEAVPHLLRSIELTAPDHPRLWFRYSVLAGCLLARHTLTSDPADLDEAIGHERTAVRELRRTGESLPARIGPPSADLARMLRLRFELHGELDDLEEAMALEAEL